MWRWLRLLLGLLHCALCMPSAHAAAGGEPAVEGEADGQAEPRPALEGPAEPTLVERAQLAMGRGHYAEAALLYLGYHDATGSRASLALAAIAFAHVGTVAARHEAQHIAQRLYLTGTADERQEAVALTVEIERIGQRATDLVESSNRAVGPDAVVPEATVARRLVTFELDEQSGWARAIGSHVGLDFDLWLTEHSGQDAYGTPGSWLWSSMVWTLFAQAALGETLHLTVELPWAYLGSAQPCDCDNDGATLGSPTAGIHLAGQVADGSVAAVLAGLVAVSVTPLAQAAGGRWAVAARGADESHRFSPGLLALRVGLSAEVRDGEHWYHRAEVSPVLHFPTESEFSELEVLIESAYELEYRSAQGIGVGGRVQAIWRAEGSSGGCGSPWGGVGAFTDDGFVQPALEPFVGYEGVGTSPFVRTGLLLGLGPCLNVFDGERKLAAWRWSVGQRF